MTHSTAYAVGIVMGTIPFGLLLAAPHVPISFATFCFLQILCVFAVFPIHWFMKSLEDKD